jgi:hypothetical protein
MSTSDGSILGTTKVIDHGPASQRWNLVILGDGYRTSELNNYHDHTQQFIDHLRSTAPFSGLWDGINVYRVDVSSTDSSASDPATCADGSTGSGTTVATYFDATFCGDGNVRRLLVVNTLTALSVATAQVPQMHMTLVVVNSSLYGGSGGPVAVFSSDPQAVEIALHEMAHTAFHLADEYATKLNSAAPDTYQGGEPVQPNITANTDRATNKWRQLIQPATPMPTTVNADCSREDAQASPVPPGTIGAFEGAGYFYCGLYRPEFNCRMRQLGNPFCAVCQLVIRQALAPFLPATTPRVPSP